MIIICQSFFLNNGNKCLWFKLSRHFIYAGLVPMDHMSISMADSLCRRHLRTDPPPWRARDLLVLALLLRKLVEDFETTCCDSNTNGFERKFSTRNSVHYHRVTVPPVIVNVVLYLWGLIEGRRHLQNSFYFWGGACTRRRGLRGGQGAPLVQHSWKYLILILLENMKNL